MIQIYGANNTDYSVNGDMPLLPAECTIEAELNGSWELTLEHPIDDEGRYKYIESGAVVSVPSFVSDKQLFRIYNTVKTDTGVTAYARPIFMDSAGEVWLMDTRPTAKNGQGALNEMLKGQSKYKGVSDISTISTAYYIRQNLIEALQSDHDESFLNRWGGEIWYDNYTVRVLKRIGGDYGMRVELGRNCLGIEADVNMSEVVTRIVPVSYNGYTLDGSKPWVDSPLINNYPVIYTKEIKFEDVKLTEDAQEDEKSFATLDLLRAELIRRCKEQFSEGIDKPACNYKCDMVQLANTDDYTDVKVLETVGLGDTVYCGNKKLAIETGGRVIKVIWDCIHKRNNSVELGDFTYNYFGKVTSAMNRVDGAIRSDGSVVAEQVSGIIDGVKSQMRAQSSIAKKSEVRAILFEDLDPNSETYGAMCFGTMGFQIAGSRTADNRDWDWRTFGTGQGFFADLMVAGKLMDKTGKSYWDLDTGEMVLSGIFRQFNRRNGYKSVDVMNNKINVYSWQKDGDYVGSIGSLANKTDPDGRQVLGIYSDTNDLVAIGYVNGKSDDGGDEVTYMVTFDSTKLGTESYTNRAIKLKEIPEIPGTLTLPEVYIGTTKLGFFNGLFTDIKVGRTFQGTFKTGAGETVNVSNGAIESVK